MKSPVVPCSQSNAQASKIYNTLWEPQKKVIFLMAVPLRGGGGKVFFKKILLSFKNLKYFTLDNLSTYGHITLKFVGRYFYWFVTMFSKKIGLY